MIKARVSTSPPTSTAVATSTATAVVGVRIVVWRKKRHPAPSQKTHLPDVPVRKSQISFELLVEGEGREIGDATFVLPALSIVGEIWTPTGTAW